MQFINYFNQDAYTNIAMDAWLLKNLHPDKPVFSLWQNKRAVIVGENQNTFSEVNADYIDAHDVQVVRRVSGGGSVYHDLGNICFTFFVPVASSAHVDFRQFVKPMADALESVGIHVDISGRNDLEIDGKKISGNAQRYAGGYLMHHGTLLWNTDVDAMVRSLNVADEKFISKAAKSVRSRVGNIKDYAPKELTIEKFIAQLQYYLTNEGKDGEYKLSETQKNDILKLRDDQFSNWSWNYGMSPKFMYNNHAKFDGGSIDTQIDVEDGKITDINFTGDFLGVRDWREMKAQFIGLPFTRQAVSQVLEDNKNGQYFGSITIDELLRTFFQKDEVSNNG
ncbi:MULTISPECIES: lipoate--protein ligase [Leuconostoc]|uniref:lipoate--protein ligase n=2 Tax=Leuconostoc kimchii TaxID=136609 RepID=D5T1I5_LEUKI|nr:MULTISPECIES: lipoate--protein ligase [Leuconostoc]ADG40134.1 lipoate-protein ligase [Leuconostoc kimchii IMSNU 11154]AEJ30068.1 lipoate-protein ligase [Leuconostoc sp. C2]QBR47161.1 lipoate--protein ligase [Leuconostoc kimchii]